MGFGSTAKKVQKLADLAEKTYKRIDELRTQIKELRGTVETTGERVERLEGEVAAQRAVLDAIAAEHDVDVEQVVEDAGVGTTNDGGDGDSGGDGTEPATSADAPSSEN